MATTPTPQVLNRIAARLKALADPTRLTLMHELEGGEVCVGELARRVGGTQANVSKHLSILYRAGLVRRRRCGMNVYYAADDDVAFHVCRLVCGALERQAEKVSAELGFARDGQSSPGQELSGRPTG